MLRDLSGFKGGYFPEISRGTPPFLAWMTSEWLTAIGYLQVARVSGNSLSARETVATGSDAANEYSAAATPTRRWVVRSDTRLNSGREYLRAFFSDSAGRWNAMPDLEAPASMCAIAPLEDGAALVVYAGDTGLRWIVADPPAWGTGGVLDPRPWHALHPRFRKKPSGGWWLTYTGWHWVHLIAYANGAWSQPESLRYVHPDQGTYAAGWVEATTDSTELPVLAWSDMGYGFTYRDIATIAWQENGRWWADEVPGSENLYTEVYPFRDWNGDIWVVWNRRRAPEIWYAHTFCSATASRPYIVGAGRRRTVQWTLSSAAPGSWWSVLRSRDGGELEPVARLRAGDSRSMSWTDSSPPRGQLAYRIRRESVGKRYEWLSEEARWPSRCRKPLRLEVHGGPVAEAVSLELNDATAGPLDLQVFDLQGRLVLHRRVASSGAGSDTFRLDLRTGSFPLVAGVYFLRALDTTGRESNTAKLVVLR
ncbi:MAG: T9SS type A sorting domain-containing protein [Candidatus Eisenbacteria bacterium]|nr:T9SS type A sorting domain-containing protein [Candidatus Eisenbacteria bacterium]